MCGDADTCGHVRLATAHFGLRWPVPPNPTPQKLRHWAVRLKNRWSAILFNDHIIQKPRKVEKQEPEHLLVWLAVAWAMAAELRPTTKVLRRLEPHVVTPPQALQDPGTPNQHQ